MASTIDMKTLRYLNLFHNITKIRTRFCFMYNNTIFFCVPRKLVSKAVGKEGKNVKRISEITRKKIKIIFIPTSIVEVREFIESIIEPVRFNDLEIKGDEIIINAGMQSKAALIGRNRRREAEMKNIISDYFSKGFKIA